MRNASENRAHVLLVEADPGERARLGDGLEAAGFQVDVCPAPTAPEYVCLGGRSGTCPLIRDADVIVFDTAIAGEDVVEGTPASELLALYVGSGRPVITLVDRNERAESYTDEMLLKLCRSPSERTLALAVKHLVDGHHSVRTDADGSGA